MQNNAKILIVLSVIVFGLVIVVSSGFSVESTNIRNKAQVETVSTNAYVKEYSLPYGTWPNGITVDKNGSVWVAGSKIHKLFKFVPEKEEITSFQIASQDHKPSEQSLMVWTMLEDNDGRIWFSQLGPAPIWSFDPQTRNFDVFDVSAAPFQMKADGDGNIWFTTLTANTVGIIQKVHLEDQNPYRITEFSLDSDSLPSGIFFEEDHVWITMIKDNKIVKFVPVNDDNDLIIGVNKIMELPNKENSISSPTDMIILDDSSIWVAEHGTSFVSRIDDGFQNIVKFPTSQNQYQATSLPFWIRSSEDGSGFWFNEHTGNKIGFFDTQKMELIEYSIPSNPSDGYIVFPLNIATDPTNDDLLWFSEWNTDKIAVVDKSIPLPFDIVPQEDQKIFVQNNTYTERISVKIIKNNHEQAEYLNRMIVLNASSSLEFNAGFGNMTVLFSTNQIDLEMNDKENIDIMIDNIPNTGNHTLGISATDGIVTKTIFFELININ